MTQNQKVYNKIKLSIWPFEKEEVAKLFWIDHPYRIEGQWVIDLYFQNVQSKKLKKCTVPWGTLPILKIGRLYSNGELQRTDSNSFVTGVLAPNKKVGVFKFSEEDIFICKTDQYSLNIEGEETCSVVSNNFRLIKNNKEFRIPVIEVIRSILAMSRKLVYAILEPNALDFYFIVRLHERDSSKARIDFTKAYPLDLVRLNQHVRHLLWISLDEQAKVAWNSVQRSLVATEGTGICFPFPIKGSFQIEARYTEKNNIIRIEEILRFSGHRFNIKEVMVTSPHLKNSKSSNRPKLRAYIYVSSDELEIDAENKGAKNTEEIVEVDLTEHEYENPPVVYRQKAGEVRRRIKKDETTLEMEIDGSEHVSTADVGSGDTLMGLEYIDMKEVPERLDGDLGEFIKILVTMDSNYDDLKVRYVIDQLPEGLKGKKFCKLDDGVTPRNYLLANIRFSNGQVVYLLEVERQGKPLSTLALKRRWDIQNIEDYVFMEILKGLVNNNGTWSKNVMKDLTRKGIVDERIRHTYAKKDLWELADRLYEKILNPT
jgi:hypothetical protein